jgi:twitching motility protein PilT
MQHRGIAAVFREIPQEIMTVEQLGLPERLRDLAMLNKGLVLVTGPTGSGKSTTLAAIIDHANKNRRDHILTVEDPIEFVHQSQGCLVNQREVGHHTQSFKAALRGALREDPDIILVGEMRDLETITLALEAAETGHLVFSTLHTQSAVKTIDRIIEVFPEDGQTQVRTSLAESLRAVVSQTLFKRIDKPGRVAAQEILMGIPSVRNMIREGKTHQLASVLQTGRDQGMQTLDDEIERLIKAGIISHEDGLAQAQNKEKIAALAKEDPR